MIIVVKMINDYVKMENQTLLQENSQILDVEREKLKRQMAAQKALTDKEHRITGELRCSWCNKWITDEEDNFYFCIYHHNIFCDRCAKNFYQREIESYLAPRCKNKWQEETDHDCIYEKRFTKLKEVENAIN